MIALFSIDGPLGPDPLLLRSPAARAGYPPQNWPLLLRVPSFGSRFSGGRCVKDISYILEASAQEPHGCR